MIYLFISLIFTSVLCLVWALLFAWNDFLSSKVVKKEYRYNAIKEMGKIHSNDAVSYKRVLSINKFISNYFKNIKPIIVLDKIIVQAGLSLRVDQFLLLVVLAVVTVTSLGYYFSLKIYIIALIILATIILFISYILLKRNKRRDLIDAQLPEALDLISQAMQAGHALSSAILLASNETSEPIATELRCVFDEINYGISTRQSIVSLSERVDSDYIRLFVASVLIQIDTGGNMAEMLKNTSFLIRDRSKFKSVTRVLTAEARISALILGLLPFVVIGLMQFINPGFISVLWYDPLGINLLISSMVLMLFGAFWIWRLVNFDY